MEDTGTLARQEREKQGPWEAEVSYGGEADLHRHLAGCDKNPGHQKFVPVDQFNVDHLPPGCQDNDLVDLVRAVSDLTVRVSVKYVSKRRPETDPGSGKPYPCYKNRGSNTMTVGTGWVRRVDKYLDEEDKYPDEKNNLYKTCSCQECQISPTPKTQFALISIDTAAHVVYDSLEAAHTTCHLFFDKGGTPEACSGGVTLRGGSVVVSDVDRDWCKMTFVTHDLDLADRLNKMADHRATLCERLNEKLDRLEAEKQKSCERLKKKLDRLEAEKLKSCERLKKKLDRLEAEKLKSCERLKKKLERLEAEKLKSCERLKKKLERLEAEKLKSCERLKKKLDRLEADKLKSCERLNEKLERLEADKLKSSSPAEDLTNAWDNLVIIVSHPHGCSKQISVGSCVDREERQERMCPGTYTTATCPGSSGACVWWVGGGGFIGLMALYTLGTVRETRI